MVTSHCHGSKSFGWQQTEKVTYSKEPKSVNAFIIILFTSCRFSPIRSQLETVLHFWLVNVCMKECGLIKGGHTFRLLGKSLFALFQTSPTLFNFIQFGKSWQNFLLDRIYGHLSLEKEIDNFFVVFTCSIKRAREIRKFNVTVVQRRQRNVQNSVIHVQS